MRSYWHAYNARPELASDELPQTADVVVLGAGVHGSSTALWLARAGLNPVLIERSGPAAGASGNNGGLLVSGASESYPTLIKQYGRKTARAIYQVSLDGYELMSTLIAEEEIDCNLRLSGHLSFALNEEQLTSLRRTAQELQADGFAGEVIDRVAAEALMGLPLGETIMGAKLNPKAGALHSFRLVHGLLSAAKRYGAQFCWGTEVLKIEQDGTGLKITTNQGIISAKHVVMTLNAWSGFAIPELAQLITPVRGQVFSTVPSEPIFTGGFGASVTPTGEYGQQAVDGRIIFGGCRAAAPNRDVGVLEPGGSPEVQGAMESAFAQIFPSLAQLPIEQRWSGTMAFTADHSPIVDAIPGIEGAWFSGGFSGHGMPFAAIFGKLLSETVQTGRLPDALDPFRIDRPSLQRGV